jgi:hypothetical protein
MRAPRRANAVNSAKQKGGRMRDRLFDFCHAGAAKPSPEDALAYALSNRDST